MLKVGAGAVAGAAGDPHKREEEEGEGGRKLKRWQKIERIFEERIFFRFLKTSLFFLQRQDFFVFSRIFRSKKNSRVVIFCFLEIFRNFFIFGANFFEFFSLSAET